jgi:phosphoribosylformylglycinamidine synthase
VGFRKAGLKLVLLGGPGDCDDVRFGGTQYVKNVLGDLWGLPPALDMEFEKRVQSAIREIVNNGLADSAHDLSDGGLAVAVAECCFPHGIGAKLQLDTDLRPEFALFGEAPSRILVSTADASRIQTIAERNGVPAIVAGEAIGERIIIRNRNLPLIDVDVDSLRRLWAGALEEKLESRR